MALQDEAVVRMHGPSGRGPFCIPGRTLRRLMGSCVLLGRGSGVGVIASLA